MASQVINYFITHKTLLFKLGKIKSIYQVNLIQKNNPSSRALSFIRELIETRVYLLLDAKISKYSYYISTNNGRAPLLLHNGYTPLESRASKRYSAFNLLDYGTIGLFSLYKVIFICIKTILIFDFIG